MLMLKILERGGKQEIATFCLEVFGDADMIERVLSVLLYCFHAK